MVSVERNVYFVLPSECLEGEHVDLDLPGEMVSMPSHATSMPISAQPTSKPETPHLTPPVPAILPPPASTPASIPELTRSQQIRKPSTYVHALQASEDIEEEEPGKAEGAEGRDEGGVLGEDSGDERAEVEDTLRVSDEEEGCVEYALAVEMGEAKGLEPRSLAEACLVVQGFSQIPGVNYFDTYALVAKLTSVHTVLAIANRNDMELHQVDIKRAYLNGDLTPAEVIYMRHPPGYAPIGSARKVLRLKHMLYGLKQSGWRWYQKLTSIFVDFMGFAQCQVDQAVFHKHKDMELMIVIIHVDDCMIAAMQISLIDDFKACLREHIEVTDLGKLH
ncbi:hypothetical protein EW146_g9670 [Bondarzewia mesenterica]|uniref:Reverse transcriptase Ty1/copia-type domain-containing protein n=1 Tax=Bondarzewia mesenterica TaxID=1095465 RepID=A0A4S4L4A0_9AGAM|nr:hypothetical protein EW146_g9670 [Bondarzewia mesenterica]